MSVRLVIHYLLQKKEKKLIHLFGQQIEKNKSMKNSQYISDMSVVGRVGAGVDEGDGVGMMPPPMLAFIPLKFLLSSTGTLSWDDKITPKNIDTLI